MSRAAAAAAPAAAAAMPDPGSLLFGSIRLDDEVSSWAARWFRAQEADANAVPQSPVVPFLFGGSLSEQQQRCPLAAVGSYVLALLSRASSLADLTVQGDFAGDYADAVMPFLLDADDGRLLDYLERKQEAIE